jgi:hypothetical protein
MAPLAQDTTIPPQQQLGPEHRVAPRRRVLLKGLVSLDGLFTAEPCNVRNLSDTGALIVFELPAVVPFRFTLVIDLLGFKVECEQVWQKGLAYGVRFVSDREETAYRRRQVLSTSETALSRNAARQIEMAANNKDMPVEAPHSAPEQYRPAPRPVFGKRN